MTVKVYKPSVDSSKNAWISDLDLYQKLYDESINNPDEFWAGIAERITWTKKWDKVRSFDFVDANIKFFEGGKLNVAYNCLDRHVEAGHGNQTALVWEGNNPAEDKKFTYNELTSEVSKFANVLKSNGVEKAIEYVFTCK